MSFGIGGGPSSLPPSPSSSSESDITGYMSETYDFESPVENPLDCPRFSNCELLRGYAMAGLHRYNFWSGTNWVFDRLKKVVVDGSLVSSYSITFYASQGEEEKAFYVFVSEQEMDSLNIVVPIAKPLDHPDDFVVPDRNCCGSLYPELTLPEWPCDFVDRGDSFFFKLERSMWERYDWVSLYLQLALCVSDWYTADQLNQIQISDVVIETYEAVKCDKQRLEAKKATLYIIYKDFDNTNRQAVIAREFDPNTGDLRLRASSGLTPQVLGLRHHNLDMGGYSTSSGSEAS